MTTPIVMEPPRHREPVTRDTFIDRLAAGDATRTEPASLVGGRDLT
jgi:hypothetical protein